jgi:hypothetical protein
MVCHYDLIVPFRAGCGTLLLQVAERSQGQFPHATPYEYVGHLFTKTTVHVKGNLHDLIGVLKEILIF